MGAKPLAEAYEELKQLRRQGDSNVEIQARAARLRTILPELRDVLCEVAALEVNQSASLVRTLEVKTLADRVFGDEEKSEAWLRRPSP